MAERLEWEKKKIKNTLLEWEHALAYCERVLKDPNATDEGRKYAKEEMAEAKKYISQIKAEIATWK